MPRPRSIAALALGIWLAVLGACSEAEQAPSRAPEPATSSAAGALAVNVVVITMDTTRADALGAYGQRLPTSPGLDRMASQGVLFEQVVTSAPSTLPSHSSIFTGKQPYAHGVRSNAGYVLSQQNVTLAEVLREHGYRTAAEISASVIGRRTQLDQGFDQYRGPEDEGALHKKIAYDEPEGIREVEIPERPATDITRKAIDFLRASGERPFFLWLHYFDPHAPYSAPGAFNARIPESAYHAEIAFTDLQIERVLREIVRLGLKSRTLVVLTSDHGEGLGEHGEDTHTFFVHDATMRVPLIFWGPDRLLENWRVKSLARTVDIVPTVLDFLGLPALEGIQGQSLLPLLTGRGHDLELPGYGESFEFRSTFGGSVLRFLRKGKWKYVHKHEPSLHDLESDPGELLNLADREPERVSAMRTQLRRLLLAAPSGPEDATRRVDAATRAELIALGYAGADAPQKREGELALFEVDAPDPDSLTEDVALFAAARGRLRHDDLVEARDLFETLLARNPRSVPVLAGLISTLRLLDENARAVELIPRVAELAPTRIELFIDLAEMARRAGEIDPAIAAMRRAVSLSPCDHGPRSTLAELLRTAGRSAERLATLESGVSECPDIAEFTNDLAWLLATHSDPQLRDGLRAVALAEAAVRSHPDPHPGLLDTLAAAHAEAGNFENAVRIESRAIALLEERAATPETIEVFRIHLAHFRAGEPLRDS